MVDLEGIVLYFHFLWMKSSQGKGLIHFIMVKNSKKIPS